MRLWWSFVRNEAPKEHGSEAALQKLNSFRSSLTGESLSRTNANTARQYHADKKSE